MIFQERKVETGYHYRVEDVFGTIDINSTKKLDAGILDDMVVLLLRQNVSAKEVTGSVKHDDGEVTYKFVKADLWSEPEEEKLCENIPTSTKKQESASIATYLSSLLQMPKRTMNWCKRFVEAFLEAWRNIHRGQ